MQISVTPEQRKMCRELASLEAKRARSVCGGRLFASFEKGQTKSMPRA